MDSYGTCPPRPRPTFRHCQTCTCTSFAVVAVVRPYQPDSPAIPSVVGNDNRLLDVANRDAAVEEEDVIVLDGEGDGDWTDEEQRVRSPTPARSDRSWTPGRSPSSSPHSTSARPNGSSHSSSSGGAISHGRRSSKRLRGRVYRYTDDHTSSEEDYIMDSEEPSGNSYRRVETASDEQMSGPSTSFALRVSQSARHYRPPTTLSSDDESTVEYEPANRN